METFYDIPEVLKQLDPAALDYTEWTEIGMALKAGGFPVTLWDEWSRGDPARYHAGDCEKKWETFKGGFGSSVNIGTIINIAKSHGWTPPQRSTNENRAFGWDDEINDVKIVDLDYLEGRELHEPTDARWNPVADLIMYLETLFDASENVGYVTKSWEKDGKHMPSAGAWDRTAGELIETLSKYKDIGAALGDYNPEVGAWIRFNPLDGKGVKNENVTEYRYALVESDTLDIDKQNAIIRQLEIPVAALVHSGKKSLHAIVKIDAANFTEYRQRVDFLYKVCQQNGLEIDKQNRNPSRLSRMPGVMRNGHKQWLVDTNIGQESWAAWKEWIEGQNDDLPDIQTLDSVFDALPPLAPALIEGVLRQGHKMLIAGPSKAGKSYALIELTIALAEGWSWLGWQCAKGRVMYVNLELDGVSCLHRFADVYAALGRKPGNLQNIDIWNLRGKAVPMDKLAPKLIRRAQKLGYIAVIIDPIYKVITGDENSADQMAAFCNQFDRICTELNCAVIYCHHHSKGVQSNKRSMDRASGSGVFARDPDAMLDLIELNVTDSLRTVERNTALCDYWARILNEKGFADAIHGDEANGYTYLDKIARDNLTKPEYTEAMLNAAKLSADIDRFTAWRVEATLREYPKPAPLYLWFKFPVHSVDTTEALQDLRTDDAVTEAKFKKAKSEKQKPADQLDAAFGELSKDGAEVTTRMIAEVVGKSYKTVERWVDKSEIYTRDGSIVTLNETI